MERILAIAMLVAILLGLLWLNLALANDIPDLKELATWEEVIRLEGPNKIILILKNPVEGDIAIVDVRSIYIAEYVLVGKDLRKFELKDFKTQTYEEVKLEFEEKLKIWSFLIKHAGIYSI